MPKARTSAQQAALKKAQEASARKRKGTGKAKPQPQGRAAMLQKEMNRLDRKKVKTAADKKKLDELYRRWKAGRSGASKAASARANNKRKKMWRYGVGSKAYDYGTGN